MKTLEARIAAALSDDVTAADLAALITEVTTAIDVADATAKSERTRALDPALSPDPKIARQLMEDAEFAASRLRTVQPRLELRYEEVAAAERSASWQKDFAVLKVERDELANEGKEFLPGVFAHIADYFSRCAALDIKSSQLHARRPAGISLHLYPAEAVARGLEHFTAATPSIAAELRLPSFDAGQLPLWPPPVVPISAFMVPPMATVGTDKDWWMTREQRAAEQAAERQRLNNYYSSEQQAREAVER